MGGLSTEAKGLAVQHARQGQEEISSPSSMQSLRTGPLQLPDPCFLAIHKSIEKWLNVLQVCHSLKRQSHRVHVGQQLLK